MNATKTKAMVGRPKESYHTVSTPAFDRRLTGDGDSYGTRKRRKIACPHCGKEVQEGHLESHLATQHNIFQRDTKRRKTYDSLHRAPVTYHCSIPTNGIQYECPVPFCNGRASSRYNMRVHFSHRHVQDVLIIDEEGPLPRCNNCDMFVAEVSLRHQNTAKCRDGAERKRKRLLDVEILHCTDRWFYVGGAELEQVECFNYLGRVLSSDGADLYSVIQNVNKARGRWARVSKLLRRQGANPKVSGYFYKAITQSVLLYSCETWTITKKLLGLLEGFHHRVARQLSSMTIRFNSDTETWVTPPLASALENSGLFSMGQYLLNRRRYLVNWVQHEPLYRICQDLQGPGGGINQRLYWWNEQPIV